MARFCSRNKKVRRYYTPVAVAAVVVGGSIKHISKAPATPPSTPPLPQGCRNHHNSTTTMTKGNNLISMCPKKRQMQVAASRSRPVYRGEDSFHTRAHICFSTLVKSTQTGPFDRPLLAQVMSSTSFYAPLGPPLAPRPRVCFTCWHSASETSRRYLCGAAQSPIC